MTRTQTKYDELDLSDVAPFAPGTTYIAGNNPYPGPPQFKNGIAPIRFDIETGPIDEEKILAVHDFPAEPGPAPKLGPFDPSSVKLGRLTDKVKIQEKMLEAQRKHAVACEEAEEKHLAAYQEKRAKLIERAALSPLTGRVLAIGYLRNELDEQIVIDGDEDDRSEAELLRNFWQQYEIAARHRLKLVGHNIFDFDLPFIVRRSWLLEVKVPQSVYTLKGSRFYFDDLAFSDTMAVWQCGQRGNGDASLDVVNRYFGGAGKNGDGAEFARLWREDRGQAVAYLVNDLRMLERIAVCMGV